MREKQGTSWWERWSIGNVQTRISHRERDPIRFWDINRSSNPDQKTRLRVNWQRICCLVDFTIPTDHRLKIKENKNINKYVDLARELRKLWKMKVKVIPTDAGAFGTVPKTLEKELEEYKISRRIETIQTSALQRWVKIIKSVLESWKDL